MRRKFPTEDTLETKSAYCTSVQKGLRQSVVSDHRVESDDRVEG